MAAPISTTYTEEERDRIVKHVLAELSGGRAVSRILREDPEMPSASTFWNWYFASPELQEKVARGRESGVEAIIDQALDIADTQEKGVRTRTTAEGTETFEEDALGHRKLRVETRLKYAQMVSPRKYGAKIDLTSGGEKIRPPSSVLAIKAAALLNAVQKRIEGQEDDDGSAD